tara:strand:+ start:1750 stop:2415 length:666 start_codon:yes stop_codon:yes gene_type:complete
MASTPGPQIGTPAPSRAATGQDVWSGAAQSGVATNGNQMTRNPDGTVSMTSSKYGYTETMNPDGSYRSTTAPGLLGIDEAVSGLFSGIGKTPTEDTAGRKTGKSFKDSMKGILGDPRAQRGALGLAAAGIPGLIAGIISGQMKQRQQQQQAMQGLLGANAYPSRPSAPSNPGSGELTGFGREAARGTRSGHPYRDPQPDHIPDDWPEDIAPPEKKDGEPWS